MASKDYDDLLESFMNNSQKVYNDDKNSREGQNNKLPSSYNISTSSEKKSNKSSKASTQDSKKNNKAKKAKKAPSQKSPVAKFFSGVGKTILALIMIVAVVGVVCVSVIAIYGYSFVHGDPVFNLTDEKYSQNQTSFIYGYDSDDNVVEITRLHGEENRIWVDSNDMSEYLSKAFIAIEDERFESHHGVDWKRTAGVTIYNLIGKNQQGGSTITQQLIKNLTDENDVTFVRKFNEILSALNLEKNYSKDEILEAYLNTVYLSHGCYGVKTAAETYFGKDVSDLNIAECACLAGITKSPTALDPLINPENNKERQEYILSKMLELGYITQDEYEEAVNYKLVFTNSKDYQGSQVTEDDSDSDSEDEINSYYVDYVIDQVLEDLQKNGYSERKAKNLIYGGGLKIYSAIDFDIQEQCEDVYENYRRMPDETVQGACVVMDYNGRILGIVGGTGEKTLNRGLNRATMSKRQPGSTIKPLSVYGPALQKSLEDDSVDIYWSTPTKDAPLMKLDDKWWPTNEGGSYSNSYVTVQRGLALSKNTISAQTLSKIGYEYSFDYITNKFHISTLDSVNDCYWAPMATGSLTYGVTVLEMTAAYATFGNNGYYYEPYSYYKIEDSQGNVIIEKDPDGSKESALSTNTAGVMNKMLQTVMTQGTGSSYKVSGVECFGKTGTTTGSNDRWFIGGTPEYVCAVWYGYDTPKEVVYNLSANPSGTLWNLIMNNIYEVKGKNKTEFDTPEGVVQREYCSSCGKLRSGSGNWGWFDENNLPGNCAGGHGDYSSSGSGSSDDDDDDDDDNSTSDNSDDDDTSETTKKQETTTKSTTEATTEKVTDAPSQTKPDED